MRIPMLGSKRTPFVKKDEIHQGPMWTAAERNVRPYVNVSPQAAPDPPRDGFTPTRPAQIPVVTFFLDMNASQDERFQTQGWDVDPVRARPRGRMTPQGERQNIAVPAHVAYGSMISQNYGGH